MSRPAHLRRSLLHGGWTLVVVLGVGILLITGLSIGPTFGSYLAGETTYNGSSFLAGYLAAPSLAAAPSGTSVKLTITPGTNGNQQDIGLSDNGTSSSCPTGSAYSRVTTVASTTTSVTDASSTALSGVHSGDNLCYQALNAYGYATVTLATQVSPGTVASLKLSSVSGPITSGDTLEVTNASGQSQSFTVGAASYPATTSATSVTISSATAAYTFAVGSTVDDTTSWTTWQSSTTSAGSLAVVRAGYVATGVTLPKSGAGIGTADAIGANATVAVSFNQAASATTPSTSYYVCTFGSTSVGSVTLNSGSATATTTSKFYGVEVGMAVTGTGVQSGTTVSAIASTTSITLSKTASSSHTGDTLSFSGGNLVLLGDSTATGATNNCRPTDTTTFGQLVLSGSGVSLANSAKYSISSYSGGGTTTLTLTINTLVAGTATTVNVPNGDTPTWTYTPVTTLTSSATPAAAACTTNPNANSLCQPATSTSF